jgi:thiosulfate/3-mercaptopyruvate sulfurtransferase
MQKEVYSPIILAEDLKQIFFEKDLIILDASNGKNARSNYETNHLVGAIYIDLDSQLTKIEQDVSHGGRHPLPILVDFLKTISNIGISPQSHVVIYDDKSGANAAARLWWMLKAIGHEKVQVLNGGIQEAAKKKLPMTSKIENKTKTVYNTVENWKLPIASINDVEVATTSSNHLVIDVRDADRYNGLTEPIDLIAGHIPGAINVPFTENLDQNGLFLPPDILKAKYEKLFETIPSDNIMVHCGSGVTACHTLLAIAYAELEIPKLYVGSWSEWSRNNKPMNSNV